MLHSRESKEIMGVVEHELCKSGFEYLKVSPFLPLLSIQKFDASMNHQELEDMPESFSDYTCQPWIKQVEWSPQSFTLKCCTIMFSHVVLDLQDRSGLQGSRERQQYLLVADETRYRTEVVLCKIGTRLILTGQMSSDQKLYTISFAGKPGLDQYSWSLGYVRFQSRNYFNVMRHLVGLSHILWKRRLNNKSFSRYGMFSMGSICMFFSMIDSVCLLCDFNLVGPKSFWSADSDFSQGNLSKTAKIRLLDEFLRPIQIEGACVLRTTGPPTICDLPYDIFEKIMLLVKVSPVTMLIILITL